MVQAQKKSRPEAGTSKRRIMGDAQNHSEIILAQVSGAVKVPVYDLMANETPERWNAKAVRINREAELERLFWAETDDPETQVWREELTDEEAALVAAWDDQVVIGMARLCREILKTTERGITA